MAKRTSFIATTTPIATADATNLVDNSYAVAFTGASTTQRSAFWEVVLSGQVQGASSPMEIPLSYDTVVAATVGGGSTVTTNPNDPASAALAAAVVQGNAFTTKPQRLAAGKMLDCSINGYGGKFKWTAYDLSFCPIMLGNSSGTGGMDISVRAGTVGVLSGHVVVETA